MSDRLRVPARLAQRLREQNSPYLLCLPEQVCQPDFSNRNPFSLARANSLLSGGRLARRAAIPRSTETRNGYSYRALRSGGHRRLCSQSFGDALQRMARYKQIDLSGRDPDHPAPATRPPSSLTGCWRAIPCRRCFLISVFLGYFPSAEGESAHRFRFYDSSSLVAELMRIDRGSFRLTGKVRLTVMPRSFAPAISRGHLSRTMPKLPAGDVRPSFGGGVKRAPVAAEPGRISARRSQTVARWSAADD